MALSDVDQLAVRRWRIGALPPFISLYVLGAALLSPQTYLEMVGNYAYQCIVLPPIVLIGVALVALLLHRDAPIAYIRRLAIERGPRLLLTALALCIGLAAFTTYKLAIPHLVPFYADAFFADLDEMLHGFVPGEVAQAVIPGWLGYGIAYLYGPVWFMLWFGLIAAMALNPDAALRRRYFWSMALVVALLGSLLAILLSSVGPVFYGHFHAVDRFAELGAQVRASVVGDYMEQAGGYLLSSYEAGRPAMGSGISAMPSMHLAVATLNAHMLWRISRFAGALGTAYVVVILVGSVYLSWHYAVDGYLSIIAASLIWWAVGGAQRRQT